MLTPSDIHLIDILGIFKYQYIFNVIMGHTSDRKLTSLMAKSLVHGY